MKIYFAVLMLLTTLFTTLAISKTDKVSIPKLGSGSPLIIDQGFDVSFELISSRYQIGDEWGKIPVIEEVLSRSAVIRRAAQATARVGGATGFYLGKFDGAHIVATNQHVCPSKWSCRGNIRFPLLGNSSFRASSVIGRFSEIDLALVEISVKSKDEEKLKKVAANFAFSKPVSRGQKLLTIGFGTANNSRRRMVANFDSDCVVFSSKNEFRKMSDPDELNTGRHQVWSFANGCDVSHGDSGSAMVDLQTGEVVGLIWTGKIPKSTRVQSSEYLEELIENPNEDIWNELSYAVPAAKIKEVLLKRIQNGEESQRVKSIFQQILLH